MLDYFAPDTITRSCAEAGLDDAVRDAFLAIAARIAASPGLAAATHDAHTGIYHGTRVAAETWAAIESAIPDSADAVYGVLALDSVRMARERQSARGIPAASYELLHQRHALYLINEHRRKTGRIGVARSYLDWFRYVGSGRLCRIGLLEYYISKNDYDLSAYANNSTGEVVALAKPGSAYDQDGYCVGPALWQAALTESEHAYIGHPIMPAGYVQKETVTLPKREWRAVLGPDSIVLDMHIPEGNTLHDSELRESLAQAETFFARHFPEWPAHAAYVCCSWLFSNLLPEFLPATSNIVRWQQQHYLFPIDDAEGGAFSFKSFLWQDGSIDLATAPCTTRLQRAVVDHVAAGKLLRIGGAFLLRADLAKFGSTPYLHASKAAIEALRSS